MKKTLISFILIFPLICAAQSKISYEVTASISGVACSSAPASNAIKNYSPMYIRDSAGSVFIINNGTTYFSATPRANPAEYKTKYTGGFTLGGRANFRMDDQIILSIGTGISYFKASRTVKNYGIGNFVSTGFLNGTLWGSGSISTLPAGTYNYYNTINKEERFQFITFNIPIGISYSKAKWQFEAGIIPAIILKSKKDKIKTNYDPSEISYVAESNFSNSQKTSFSLSASPTYQVSKNICLGLEYIHGISPGLINAYDVYKLSTRTLSLKALYKIKT